MALQCTIYEQLQYENTLCLIQWKQHGGMPFASD
jgi:hypothetical protein